MLSNFYLVLRIGQLMAVKFASDISNFIEKPRRVPIVFFCDPHKAMHDGIQNNFVLTTENLVWPNNIIQK